MANHQQASYETLQCRHIYNRVTNMPAIKHCNVLTPQQSATSPKPSHTCIALYVTLYEQRAHDKMFCKILKYIFCITCQLAIKTEKAIQKLAPILLLLKE